MLNQKSHEHARPYLWLAALEVNPVEAVILASARTRVTRRSGERQGVPRWRGPQALVGHSALPLRLRCRHLSQPDRAGSTPLACARPLRWHCLLAPFGVENERLPQPFFCYSRPHPMGRIDPSNTSLIASITTRLLRKSTRGNSLIDAPSAECTTITGIDVLSSFVQSIYKSARPPESLR